MKISPIKILDDGCQSPSKLPMLVVRGHHRNLYGRFCIDMSERLHRRRFAIDIAISRRYVHNIHSTHVIDDKYDVCINYLDNPSYSTIYAVQSMMLI